MPLSRAAKRELQWRLREALLAHLREPADESDLPRRRLVLAEDRRDGAARERAAP